MIQQYMNHQALTILLIFNFVRQISIEGIPRAQNPLNIAKLGNSYPQISQETLPQLILR
jgi:hypothetical protein